VDGASGALTAAPSSERPSDRAVRSGSGIVGAVHIDTRSPRVGDEFCLGAHQTSVLTRSIAPDGAGKTKGAEAKRRLSPNRTPPAPRPLPSETVHGFDELQRLPPLLERARRRHPVTHRFEEGPHRESVPVLATGSVVGKCTPRILGTRGRNAAPTSSGRPVPHLALGEEAGLAACSVGVDSAGSAVDLGADVAAAAVVEDQLGLLEPG
jgi:hypothetical protein